MVDANYAATRGARLQTPRRSHNDWGRSWPASKNRSTPVDETPTVCILILMDGIELRLQFTLDEPALSLIGALRY